MGAVYLETFKFKTMTKKTTSRLLPLIIIAIIVIVCCLGDNFSDDPQVAKSNFLTNKTK